MVSAGRKRRRKRRKIVEAEKVLITAQVMLSGPDEKRFMINV